jgi:hypothetical protein
MCGQRDRRNEESRNLVEGRAKTKNDPALRRLPGIPTKSKRGNVMNEANPQPCNLGLVVELRAPRVAVPRDVICLVVS